MTPLVPQLTRVTKTQRTAILMSPRTIAAHATLMADIPAMSALETGGKPATNSLLSSFTAAAWNIERGLDPQAIAAHLHAANPGIVLLSEADHGMARTVQRNTTAEIAKALNMTYAFGVEFYEIGLGGPTERAYCADDFNTNGWHGNAILSSVPFNGLKLIRLPEDAYWFREDTLANSHEPRVGSRMAIAAIVPTAKGPLCIVSTHLESNAGVPYRAAQMQTLLDEVDAFAPNMPVLIGGDLNTGNRVLPDFDWRHETLFADAQKRGYDWSASPPGITTRASLITPPPSRKMRLDWFAMRGLRGTPHPLHAPEGADGTPLSDHCCIFADLTVV